jgi:glycosyltransferase involved in cell wall biosynthesis
VSRVHVVVPAGIADPARVSGGNRYDQQVCTGLRAAGWTVDQIAVPGPWPRPDAAALDSLARSLDTVGDGALVLTAARAVVTTSDWTRRQLLDRYALPRPRVHVAQPGTEPAPLSPGTADGGGLLCVATLAPHKGQDLLLDALAGIPDLPWRCTLVGPLDRDPPFVASLRRRAGGMADRVRITGPRAGAALQREYREADLLVVPSRAESYGMVVTEALAAGLPVAAARVGGVREAVGRTEHGVPGLLVPPGDSTVLADALARWLTDAALRGRLRRAALRRRDTLPGWRTTSDRIAAVLSAVRAEPDPAPRRKEQ